jgi:hypothetical protein
LFLTLEEKLGLSVKGKLEEISRPKGSKEGSRKSHEEELYDLHSSSYSITENEGKEMIWALHVAWMTEMIDKKLRKA